MRNIRNSFSYSIHSIAMAELQEQARSLYRSYRAEIKCNKYIFILRKCTQTKVCLRVFLKKVKVLESDYQLRNLKIIFLL